jgi:hypothetical protein
MKMALRKLMHHIEFDGNLSCSLGADSHDYANMRLCMLFKLLPDRRLYPTLLTSSIVCHMQVLPSILRQERDANCAIDLYPNKRLQYARIFLRACYIKRK